jgi:hypothetical protein
VTSGKSPLTTPLAPLPRDRMIALVRLAQSPLAKALVALAYYSSTADSDVADAVWS